MAEVKVAAKVELGIALCMDPRGRDYEREGRGKDCSLQGVGGMHSRVARATSKFAQDGGSTAANVASPLQQKESLYMESLYVLTYFCWDR